MEASEELLPPATHNQKRGGSSLQNSLLSFEFLRWRWKVHFTGGLAIILMPFLNARANYDIMYFWL
jgi:hypothetical protein